MLFCLLTVITLSCSKQDNEVVTTTMQEQILTKKQLINLSPELQKQYWIKRLESYKDLNISEQQKSIIEDLRSNLETLEYGDFFISQKLKEDALKIAKITPRQDFLSLFTDINSNPVISNQGDVCLECIEDLESYIPNNNVINNAISRDDNVDCDCRWFCADPITPCEVSLSICNGSANQGPCCNRSGSCGLFLLQSCTNAVVSTGNC